MKKYIFIICSAYLTLHISCRHNNDTKQILDNLKDKIYINLYMSGDLSPNFKKLETETLSILRDFQNMSNKEIDFNTIPYQNQSTYYSNQLSHLDIFPIWVKKDSTYHKIYPYAIAHFREKSITITLHNANPYDTINEIDHNELSESIKNIRYNITEAIYLLNQEEKKDIAFLLGHEELDSNQTWSIRSQLSKIYNVEHFNIREFETHKTNNHPNIDRQIEKLNKYKVVIIAKPKKEFLDLDQYIIDQYIMNGGRVMWLIDGTDAHMNNFNNEIEFSLNKNNTSLNRLLSNYGVIINHDLIQDNQCTKIPILYEKEIQYVKWEYNPKILIKENHIITNEKDSILTDFASSITILDSSKTKILIKSSMKSNIINEKEKVHLNIIKSPNTKFTGEKIIGVLIEGRFTSRFKNYQKYYDNTLSKTISEENKMIVISDGDIIRNLYKSPNHYYPLGYYHYEGRSFRGNTNFIINSIKYLAGDEILLKIKNNKK